MKIIDDNVSFQLSHPCTYVVLEESVLMPQIGTVFHLDDAYTGQSVSSKVVLPGLVYLCLIARLLVHLPLSLCEWAFMVAMQTELKLARFQ